MAYRDSLRILEEGPAEGAGSGYRDSLGILRAETPSPVREEAPAPERRNALTMQEAPTSARPRQVNALAEMVPFDEAGFRKWFTGVALRTGITPAPDIHPIDFRRAYQAGAEPELNDEGEYVWSPEFQKSMPVIPQQVSHETIATTTEQISPETIGDPIMEQAGRREAMRKTAEAEIEKRLDEMIKAPFVKEQQDMAVPEKEIEAELGGVQQSWVDPVDVATTAGGFTAKFALSRGATLVQAIGRSLAAAGPAAAMDIPIGTLVDQIAEDNPELALLTSIGLGLASGITVENLAERGLLKLTRTIAGKYPQEAKAILSEDVLSRFKEGAPSETWTPEISEAQAAKMEKWKAKAAARAQTPDEETLKEKAQSTLEQWIREQAAGKQGRDFDQKLKRVSEDLQNGAAPEGMTSRDVAELLPRTLDRETGEILDASNPEWPRTGTLLDFLEGQEQTRISRGRSRKEQVPFSRSGGTVEDVIVSRTGPEKPFSDSIHILNPPKERSIVEGPVSIETARGKSIQAGMEASAKQREAADNTSSLTAWISRKGGVIPTSELEDLALTTNAQGRKVSARGIPPGFLNKKGWSLDELVDEAIGEGFISKGADENDLLEAIQRDLGASYGLGRKVTRARDIESLSSDELAEQEMDWYTRGGKSALWMHPSTITGPLGGVAAGFDREAYEKDGTISIDPKKALIGAFAGVAGGAALPRVRSLGNRIANTWDRKVAEPFLNFAKDSANNLIVHEELRHAFGLGRSKVFQKMMKDYQRDVERLWEDAVTIGKQIQEIAPSGPEQKRMLEVIRGSVTANPEMAKKGEELGKLFNDLRERLREHNLLMVSRFDKLTRKERTRLRQITTMPDPGQAKNFSELKSVADKIGMDLRRGIGKDELIDKIRAEMKFARERLWDYDHEASARSYWPIAYERWEGLGPKQKKVIEDEINELKVKSRRGNPEGRQDLEALISNLEGMLGKGAEARRQQRTTYKGLVRSYSHERLELPIEVRRALGLIETAAYPTARSVGIQETDIRKAKLFEDISQQPGLTIRPKKGMEMPSNYIEVNDQRFGALDGLWVRRDVFSDLKEVEEWRSYWGQKWDRAMGLWKLGKAVWNPATQARNFFSNMVLAYLGDVSPVDVKTYTNAAKALKAGEKNELFREAKNWGLFSRTWFSTEIGKLRDDLEAVRDPSALKNWIRSAFSIPGDVYEGSERFFKMAVFTKGRQSGLSVDEAARKAQHYLFDYGDIPPAVKFTRRWLSPFAVWGFKAIPLFAEQAIRKPHKVGAILATIYGLEQLSKNMLGLSDEEAEKERALLPEWQKRRVIPGIGPNAHVLMPFEDAHGNRLYMDLEYLLPFSGLSERWGQSAIPFADLLPNNPLFTISAAILTNKESFTGREIYNQVLDSSAKIAEKYVSYAWKEVMPSMAPGGHSWSKLKTGLMNHFTDRKVKDWAGRELDLQTAVLSSIFGVKLNPASTQALQEFELSERKKIIRSVRQERNRLRGRYEKNELDAEEYREEAKKLQELQKSLMLQKKEETGF